MSWLLGYELRTKQQLSVKDSTSMFVVYLTFLDSINLPQKKPKTSTVTP